MDGGEDESPSWGEYGYVPSSDGRVSHRRQYLTINPFFCIEFLYEFKDKFYLPVA